MNAKPPSDQLKRIWRAKLDKLCRLRFDSSLFLPHNDDGRRILTAQLCFGLTDEAVTKFGWWCEGELPELRRRRIKWDDIGQLIGLTFKEWKDAKLYHLRPIDATAEDIEAWREEQRKKSWAKAQKKRREKLKAEKARKLAAKERKLTRAKAEANPRHAAILTILAENGAQSVAELVKRARRSHAFVHAKCRNTTWCGKIPRAAIVANLRDAVHETLNQLEAKGAIGTSKVPGKRGPERWAGLVEQAEIGSVGASEGSVGASDTMTAENPMIAALLAKTTPVIFS